MNKLFTFIICTLFFQIVKADNREFLGGSKVNLASHGTNTRFKIAGDTTILPVTIHPQPLSYQGSIFKRRLDSIKKDIPLDYNEYVQGYIDIYMHNREEMAHVLGLTKYYFPIYEKAFRDAGIPEEIKYLSIVESKLDPYAVSRVGATGPWQFMFTTAKLYGLNIDNYVDDRRDPIQASYAAAAYLKDAYQEFGDWLVAIASYNCGKSNVERAIEKAGASDFWSIRQYLPVETRGYVPAYIAVAYVMNYYNKHNIVPQPWTYSLKTDTVLVNKYVSLGTVANALGVSVGEMTMLNPSYKKLIINGTVLAPRRMIIPQIDKGRYGALYNALNKSDIVAIAPQPEMAVYHEKADKKPAFHKVKRGETLEDIADTYGIELQDLKLWNHLHTNKPTIGQVLKLTDNTEAQIRPASKFKDNFSTSRVKKGDTVIRITSTVNRSAVDRMGSLNN